MVYERLLRKLVLPVAESKTPGHEEEGRESGAGDGEEQGGGPRGCS